MTNISAAKTKLHQHRAQFPALANKTYLNYGGQGPMAQGAMDAITQTQADIQHTGPFGNEAYAKVSQAKENLRDAIASQLQAPPESITLTEDVTVGCNIAMWGIDWGAGDHMLLSDCEHPGVIAASQEIARRFAVEVTTCPLKETLNTGDPVTVIAQHLRPNTRLVILSHVFWNTGQVLPLDKIVEICRANNSLVLVDAAQSVGLLPLNLSELGADFYAFTGHKWLCGPAGVGGLYVRPEVREKLQPTFIGLRGIVVDSQAQPVNWQPDGRRYEVSTSATPLYVGLTQAIAIHQQWGTAQERYQQICRNSEYLWQQLGTLPDVQALRTCPPESGIVSFQLNQPKSGVHFKLVQFLESQKILTRTIADPDCIRATVHYLTLESEIDQLIEGVQKFIQT
ncbi:aminotransferase class V-fold PLP-dependent enzyme [Nodularia spumigena CS-591/12]|uniref:aminotransferase class V-fold PLP-dependent enzyme n=1 Tax=Nodularia spumigena TaxID=70799 RepID=UPI00232CF703|nr:aminotransferase class V-fold PLP-dependent enzyme [Nodularia spumigena]MDB9304856.1 aminotransferase class V-fold PLP-dependent enzyme [Nodularia spumigena CS-591/12]MDB9323925.1 aminotransferase class V-fold PLP-dependent enzyme [Nodularia spumigena CS-591/07A]MDB9332595.1 aminotransferase class V-fold PLP-dependent enzyme [Nodularia spumigena CS-591/04]MDB9346758.1 aminotransferase class V-fold PLP-dependent enzyme [Nodularia spumigena CS-588/01]MDB9353144.1 aminotransferase class V-fold